MELKKVLTMMTDSELERLFEHLQSARGLFVAAMPYNSEVERMIKSEEYQNLTFMSNNAFLELSKRELQKQKEEQL